MRVELMAGYVLHSRPYRNTSLLVDVFSLGFGRIVGVAKGVERARSPLHHVKFVFTPLELSWIGHSEMKTFTAAQAVGAVRWLQGRALMGGLYVNELLMKLLHRGDAHEALFGHYERVLAALASGCDAAVALRLFEKALVAEMGFGLCFERDAASCPLQPDALYFFDPDCGVCLVEPSVSNAVMSRSATGKTLMALGQEKLLGVETLREAKRFLRSMIQHCLGDAVLQSPLMWRQLGRSQRQCDHSPVPCEK